MLVTICHGLTLFSTFIDAKDGVLFLWISQLNQGDSPFHLEVKAASSIKKKGCCYYQFLPLQDFMFN